jgi:fumarate reductase flavoprotein subunit
MADDYEVDAVIVGGGACGMMAALRAADRGAKSVAIFEKSTKQGSNSEYSSGSLVAGGTRWPR